MAYATGGAAMPSDGGGASVRTQNELPNTLEPPPLLGERASGGGGPSISAA